MIPFKGAIFDLDGTLLDSLYVWRKVDERFFGVRRIEVPGDYSRAVSGMSFGETVAYTIQRFGLKETPEERQGLRPWTPPKGLNPFGIPDCRPNAAGGNRIKGTRSRQRIAYLSFILSQSPMRSIGQ